MLRGCRLTEGGLLRVCVGRGVQGSTYCKSIEVGTVFLLFSMTDRPIQRRPEN